MRKVIGGNGSDTTAATQAWLEETVNPTIRDLIIIGPPEDPKSIYLTNHDRPLFYTPYGLFRPAVVSRDRVNCKVGLDSQSLAINWTPGQPAASSQTSNTGTASPYQLAAQHFFDNWPVLILKCFLPTPGDANTLGATPWYGGRIHNAVNKRNRITFNTKDYLDVLNQKVPTAVVEVTNTLASSAPVTLPAGDPSVPIFSCIAPSSEDYIVADCLSPTADKIYSGNQFAGGYMVFLAGSGATLAGAWAPIGQNGEYTDGHGNHHSEFEIYGALPWPPTPGVDTFYVSATAPINLGDEGYYGFPYVPQPQSSV
jgi:hypothetical protein